jgi:hypothetical protein
MSSRSQVIAWIVAGFVLLGIGLAYVYVAKPEWDRLQGRLAAVEQQNVELTAKLEGFGARLGEVEFAQSQPSQFDFQLLTFVNEMLQEVNNLKQVVVGILENPGAPPAGPGTGAIEAKIEGLKNDLTYLSERVTVLSERVTRLEAQKPPVAVKPPAKPKQVAKRCNKPVIRCDHSYPMRCEAV